MAMAQNSHTIILAQFSERPSSKHYSDHETVENAIEAVCQIYETQLKMEHPDQNRIEYDLRALFEFIDGLPDLAALVYDSTLSAYVPHNKEWIKKQIYNRLKLKIE